MRHLASLLILAILITACAAESPGQVVEIVRVYLTATPKPTRVPTASPSPSPTSSPTPTATPTALPATIKGNPRAYQLLDPTPSYGAACGLVDTFDFPLDPPNGEEASGGHGFGAYNSRYEKYHAGEDWGFRNKPNFGEAVYSIGHGQVTYAAPNGWGLDRGTVVIRHISPWGGMLLSFYGHLDPPSVKLKAGDCVQRGDKVGEIGDPRTPPHLHFETRLHLPISAGHGYWSSDPAQAGWLPPSQTIWKTRMLASPGVLWAQPYAQGLTQALGTFQQDFILIREGEMRAVDPADGTIQWSQPISDTIKNALLDPASAQVYQLDLRGDLSAYALPGPGEPIWKIRLNTLNSAELIPLREGGLLVGDRRRVIAVSPLGETLWQAETLAPPTSWVQIQGQVVFTTSNSEKPLWSGDEKGITPWDLKLSGKLALSNNSLYLYAQEGLYQLDVDAQTAELVLPLPGGDPGSREVAGLETGGLILLQTDRYDRRLLYLDPDGSLGWKRSIRALAQGEQRLVSYGEQAYLVITESGFSTRGSTNVEVALYALDLESGDLTHILTGGTRQLHARDTWLAPMGIGLLMVNIGGGPMAAFAPETALDILSAP